MLPGQHEVSSQSFLHPNLRLKKIDLLIYANNSMEKFAFIFSNVNELTMFVAFVSHT